MRTTKAIREYITKQVNAKAEEKYTAIRAEFAPYEDALQQFKDEIDKMLKEVEVTIRKNAETQGLNIEAASREIISTRYNYVTANKEAATKFKAALKEVDKWREDAIESIIVTLDLGGNKADLDRMLSEL